MRPVLDRIRELLESHKVAFREVGHEPTFTSEQSASARGEEVKIGGKALLIKLDDRFHLFVLSAAKKIDSKAIKRYFKVKKTRFATAEELQSLTGLVPGSVPPFGRPILDFDLYVDESVLENKKIAFNAGSLTDSIVMSVEDYLQISSPTVFCFSQDS